MCLTGRRIYLQTNKIFLDIQWLCSLCVMYFVEIILMLVAGRVSHTKSKNQLLLLFCILIGGTKTQITPLSYTASCTFWQHVCVEVAFWVSALIHLPWGATILKLNVFLCTFWLLTAMCKEVLALESYVECSFGLILRCFTNHL